MGTTMTLLRVIEELDKLDKECTIYASAPWTETSIAVVLREPESGQLPYEAERLGLKYFLEVFIAHDFILEWATSQNGIPSNLQKCLRLIEYATHDT